MTRVAGPLADAQEPGRRVAASPGGAPFAAAGPEPRRGRGAEPRGHWSRRGLPVRTAIR